MFHCNYVSILTVNNILSLISLNLNRSRDSKHVFWGYYITHALVPLHINQHTKFEVLSFFVIVIHPSVGCHYFPPGMRLPSQPHSIIAPWPVSSYTAWWQRHIGVNNLLKVVTQLLFRVGFEPTTCWSQIQRSIRHRAISALWLAINHVVRKHR